MENMEQKRIKRITGKIVVKTGLHIGSGNDKVEIGGIDNPVIKTVTGEPYIPGSSIKGKMRALLEWEKNTVRESHGNPCNCQRPKCPICRVFGSGNTDEKEKAMSRGPTRLIIRDAELNDDFRKKNKGKPILEDKTENTLNRITAKANPRHMERVIPGVEFAFELIYRVIDTGDGGSTDEGYFNSVVKKGLKLLEENYLGGSGSRGYGRIKFEGLKEYKDSDDKTGASFDLKDVL